MSSAVRQVRDDADLARWHEVYRRAYDADYVDLPADVIEEQRPRLGGDLDGERHELWVLLAGDQPVAAGDVRLPLHDNEVAANIDVQVVPDARRRGHGRRLTEHLVDRARQHGRRRVFLEIPEPLDGDDDAPGRRLASRLGARPVLMEIRRMLDLTAVPDARLAELQETAAAHATGYTILQWCGPAPVELHDDLAALLSRMSTDPPLGDMDWEPEKWDAERYRATEVSSAVRGRTRVAAAARDERTGRLAGYTALGLNRADLRLAFQWETIVAPEHRGHRLGMLLKAANLRQLRDEVPRTRLVHTWNAGSNAHMVAINHALGFRPMERWWEWQLDLSG